MKKYIVSILVLVCVLGLVGCGQEESLGQEADNQMIGNETDGLSTIEGTVLKINETNILINESGYENGECYLNVSGDTVIYVDGKKSNISMIEVGQTIKAMYTGGIEETYPARINEVTEIIAD